MQVLRTIFGGFLMGTADVVPGVSGGTIALVLGIYERLINSIREGSSALGSILKADFASMRNHLRNVEWAFLFSLMLGILSAVVLLASLLETQLEENPTILSGLFLGLVGGSVVIAWRRILNPEVGHWLIAGAVGAVLFVLLGLGESQDASDPSYLAYFGAGALAICAMILPGISGSLILLMLGMYEPVLAAVSDRDFTTIAVVGMGAVVGLALFSQVLNWALRNYHDLMLAALVGLMAGSTRVLWPWPDGVTSAELEAPGDDWVAVTVATVVGLLAVYLISKLAVTKENELSEQPSA